MQRIARTLQDAYELVEYRLGRSWPVWIVGLLVYAALARILLTKVALPSPMHLTVYTMAAAILIVTLVKVDWAIYGLGFMMPFARPGFTVGPLKLFHVAGFDVAVVGVWLVFLIRYFADRELAAKGPLVRRTPIDSIQGVFILLVLVTTMINQNFNTEVFARINMLVFLKAQLLYVAWFYLLVTLLRTPSELRRFAIVFGLSGLLVSAIGFQSRLTGAIEVAGMVTDEELMHGVVGGRTGGIGEGGWFGLGHPNVFGLYLVMSMPLWFYAVWHFKRIFHKLMAYVAVVIGLLALLYTYSRSSWGAMGIGIGSVGLRFPKTLRSMVILLVFFAIVAQFLTLAIHRVGVVDAVMIRVEQLTRSAYSARPAIFAGVWELIKSRPWQGVGMGAFHWHVSVGGSSEKVSHGHNTLLTYAGELGIPAALAYAAMLGLLLFLAARSLKAASVPGYGFLSQAFFVGLIGATVAMFAEHPFFTKEVGYPIYSLFAMVVTLDRMVREGLISGAPRAGAPDLRAVEAPGGVWIGS